MWTLVGAELETLSRTVAALSEQLARENQRLHRDREEAAAAALSSGTPTGASRGGGEGASAVAAGGGREQRDARAREMQRPSHFSRRPCRKAASVSTTVRGAEQQRQSMAVAADGWCVGQSRALCGPE